MHHYLKSVFTQWLPYVTLLLSLVLLIGRNHFFFGTLLNLSRWGLILVVIGYVFYFFRKKRIYALAVNLLILIALIGEWSWSAKDFFLKMPSLQAPTTTEMTLLTYNLLYEGGNSTLSRQILSEHPADLLVLQEFTPYYHKFLHPLLHQMYPYHLVIPIDHPTGTAIYATFPISTDTVLNNQYHKPMAQCIQATFKDIPFYLCNAHFSSSSTAFEKPLYFYPTFKQNVADRRREWTEVNAAIEQNAAHIKHKIIIGDLNTFPAEPLYREFCTDFTDVFAQVGTGFGATFPNISRYLPYPLFRIDYVFIQGNIQPISAEVIPQSGSDHLPMMATIQF